MGKNLRVTTLLMAFALIGLSSCRESGKDIYPLDEGRTWTYRVSTLRPGLFGSSSGNAKLIVTNLAARELKNTRIIPQQMELTGLMGQVSFFSFFSEDKSGVYELAFQQPGFVEPEFHTSAAYLLKYPLTGGAPSWEARPMFMGEPSPRPLTMAVESTDEAVTVPGGTFTGCVRVKGTGGVIGNESMQTLAWYAPSVGLVKRISTVKGPGPVTANVTLELVSHGK